MIKKTVRRMNLFIGKLMSGKETDGMAGWEIILSCLAGIVVIAVVITAATGVLPSLWESMVTKFKSILAI